MSDEEKRVAMEVAEYVETMYVSQSRSMADKLYAHFNLDDVVDEDAEKKVKSAIASGFASGAANALLDVRIGKMLLEEDKKAEEDARIKEWSRGRTDGMAEAMKKYNQDKDK